MVQHQFLVKLKILNYDHDFDEDYKKILYYIIRKLYNIIRKLKIANRSAAVSRLENNEIQESTSIVSEDALRDGTISGKFSLLYIEFL